MGLILFTNPTINYYPIYNWIFQVPLAVLNNAWYNRCSITAAYDPASQTVQVYTVPKMDNNNNDLLNSSFALK